jgi:hypothetical protein
MIIERGLEVSVISEAYIDIAKFTGRPQPIRFSKALEDQCKKDLTRPAYDPISKMTSHISTFLPVTVRTNATDLDIEMQDDTKKLQTEHVENIHVTPVGKEIQYTTGEENEKPRTGLRKLLRRNASVEFVREVARVAEEDDLDIREVRAVEKRIQWLIIPALAVCYGFYYIDKTTLSYAAVSK